MILLTFYSIVPYSTVFYSPEESYFGTVYTSDDRGILYSKSLERHLFGGEGKSDFTNVTSMRGVYLTNVLEEGTQLRINTIWVVFFRNINSPKRGGTLIIYTWHSQKSSGHPS